MYFFFVPHKFYLLVIFKSLTAITLADNLCSLIIKNAETQTSIMAVLKVFPNIFFTMTYSLCSSFFLSLYFVIALHTYFPTILSMYLIQINCW